MKRVILSAAAALAALTASAEGFQVNNLSSRQNGMGHVGTAMKLGAESLHFNPAAAAFQSSRFDISAGITGIKPSATFVTQNDYSSTPLQSYDSKSGISTPLYLYFNYKPADRVAVGVSFTTPFGSAIEWDDNWAGAHLIQGIHLQAYQVQPTLSVKITDRLSVGAGLTVAWGKFDLSRSMMPVGLGNLAIAGVLQSAASQYTAAAAQAAAAGLAEQAAQYEAMAAQAAQGAQYIAPLGSSPLVSAKLKGNSGVAVGVNAGIMWDPHEQWTLGFAYRSRMNMKVSRGTAALNYHDETVRAILAQVNAASIASGGSAVIPELDRGTFATQLPLPTNLTWAASFRPAPKWEFAVDLQWIGWSAYKDLNVSFNEPELEIDDIYSVKNYKNSLAFRFGGEYKACSTIHARMGMYVDESPVRSDYLNPETPSATKLAFTAGLTINPCSVMAIDLAYAYVATADPERTGSYPYEFNGTMMPLAGNYRIHAHTFSLGMRFHF